MECLRTLIGLKGGCAEIAADASLFLNSKVTYQELSMFLDQNDHPSVDAWFDELRTNAVNEVLSEYQLHMQGKYIARTIVQQQTLGNYSNGLTLSAATGKYKGVLLDRCSKLPLGYRVTKISFIGNYTGNVAVLYIDGLTGQTLATDTIVAVAGEQVTKDVNRIFNIEELMVVYDATAISGYETKIDCYIKGCISCPKWRYNRHCTARPLTATIGSPLTQTFTNEMGGLIVDVSMECDHESWLCGIKQQLGMSLLWKIAELSMEYAISNSGRSNTKTVMKLDGLKERHGYYKDQYAKSLETALSRVILPNEPLCFHCKKRNGIYVSIP